MSRIEKLSKEQEEYIPIHRDKWLNILTETVEKGLDEDSVCEGVKWLYSFCDYPEPMILFMDSPLGCQVMGNILNTPNIKENIRENIWENIRENIWGDIRENIEENIHGNIWENIEENIWGDIRENIEENIHGNIWENIEENIRGNILENIMGNIRENIWLNIRENIRKNIWVNIWENIEENIWENIWVNIWENIRVNIRENIRVNIWENIRENIWENIQKKFKYVYPSLECYGAGGYWYAYADYFYETGLCQNYPEEYENLKKYIQTGVLYPIFLQDVAIISRNPIILERDGDNRLHCETGPAIRWKDGLEYYYWHGIKVPEKLISNPEQVTREEILGLDNVEVRRAYQERLEDKYATLLDLITIDTKYLNGSPVTLQRTRDKDNLVEDYLYFVQVTCPSTGRVYNLCVPEHTEALEALAWTFNETKETYQPEIET